MPRFGQLGNPGKHYGQLGGGTDGTATPIIILSAQTVEAGAANSTVIGTAGINVPFTGTPTWSLADDDSGTFAIHSGTGVVTVADRDPNILAVGTRSITIAVSGTTPDPADKAFAIFVVDTTAPVLSGATGISSGATTADIDVSTNEDSGTLYWVVTQSASAPTAAQVKAGLNHLGAAADDAGSQAISGTGAQGPIAASGLTTDTPYYAHFMQEDDSANQSNIASSADFTPTADTTPDAPTLEWTSDEDDITPNFDVGLVISLGAPHDTEVDDVLIIQYQPTGEGWVSPSLYLSHVITAEDLSEATLDEFGPELDEGVYDFRARLERGLAFSEWTADVEVTIDLSPPGGTFDGKLPGEVGWTGPTTGLVAAWPMMRPTYADEAGALLDSVGSLDAAMSFPDRVATNTNGPSGTANYALDFDGTDDTGGVSWGGELDVEDDFTIAFWVNPDDVTNPGSGGTRQTWLDFFFGASNAECRIAMQTGIGAGAFGIGWGQNGAQSTANVAAGTLSISNWQHLAFVYDVGLDEMKIYHNAVEKTIASTGNTLGSNETSNLYIAAATADGSFGAYNGKMANLVMYQAALSPSEVLQLMNADVVP